MRVSVVLLLFFLFCAELEKSDAQVTAEDLEAEPSEPQTKSKEETPELLTDQTIAKSNVWTELRELRDMVMEWKVKLQNSQSQIEELKKENAALAGRVTSTEQGVKVLRELNANTTKVAFSFASGFSGSHGPFNVETRLVFNKKFINIGNAYSPITGAFTAPMRGAYYFRLSVFGNDKSRWIGVDLLKNQENVFYLSEFPGGTNEYASNSVILLLEKGDILDVKLRRDRRIFDNTDNHCTFSGFLLFPM